MAWVSVHTVGVEKKGMLNSKTWRTATEKLQYSHVPLLFSQDRLFWGGEAAGTFIFEAVDTQMQIPQLWLLLLLSSLTRHMHDEITSQLKEEA